MKIHFSYSPIAKEEFELHAPEIMSPIANDSADEISGDCLHQVPDLVKFIEDCYRVLKPNCKAIFTVPHFTHAKAWTSPLTKRAMCEHSLNFASKDWREQNKYTEITVMADFLVEGQFAVADSAQLRSDEVKNFWAFRYNNVVEAVLFTLTKKSP